MNSCLRRILPVFVFLSGLVSCTKEPVEDGWVLPAPVVETTDGTHVTARKFVHSNALLDPDSNLAFAADPTGMFMRAMIKAETRCKSLEGSHKAISQFKGQARVAVRSLLPSELWRRSDLSALGNVICNFTLEAKNEIGSTWTFKAENVPLRIAEPEIGLTIGKSQTGQYRVADTGANNDVGETSYGLYCDQFSSSYVAEEPDASTTLKVLAESKPDWTAQTVSGIKTDSRKTHTKQNCRLVAESFDAGGLKRIRVSPQFEYRFPPPQVVTNVAVAIPEIPFMDPNQSNFRHGPFLQIHIENKDAVPVAYRFSHANSVKMRFQSVTWKSGEYRYTGTGDGVMKLAISGYSRSLLQGDEIAFEIPPGGKVIIVGSVQTSWFCTGAFVPEGFNKSPYHDFVGYFYEFNSKVYLSRLDNWDADKPNFLGSSAEVEVLPYGSEVKDDRVLSGFVMDSKAKTAGVFVEKPVHLTRLSRPAFLDGGVCSTESNPLVPPTTFL